MNRRKGIWLFPFFNIMICVIGVLLLVGAVVVGFSLDKTGIVSTNAVLQSINEGNASSPIYVEWDGKQMITHPVMSRLEIDIPNFRFENSNTKGVLAKIEKQAEGTYFERVIGFAQQSGGRRYVVVLVRPTGFDNFIYLREFLLAKGIALGYEPVGQYWEFEPSGEPCF